MPPRAARCFTFGRPSGAARKWIPRPAMRRPSRLLDLPPSVVSQGWSAAQRADRRAHGRGFPRGTAALPCRGPPHESCFFPAVQAGASGAVRPGVSLERRAHHVLECCPIRGLHDAPKAPGRRRAGGLVALGNLFEPVRGQPGAVQRWRPQETAGRGRAAGCQSGRGDGLEAGAGQVHERGLQGAGH